MTWAVAAVAEEEACTQELHLGAGLPCRNRTGGTKPSDFSMVNALYVLRDWGIRAARSRGQLWKELVFRTPVAINRYTGEILMNMKDYVVPLPSWPSIKRLQSKSRMRSARELPQ